MKALFSTLDPQNRETRKKETVSHEYILKILLADFYIDKNYYIDIFHFDDYLNKQE